MCVYLGKHLVGALGRGGRFGDWSRKSRDGSQPLCACNWKFLRKTIPQMWNHGIMEWFALETPPCACFFISFRDSLRKNPQSHNRNNWIYFLQKNLKNWEYLGLKSSGLRFILIFKLVTFFPALYSVSKYNP